MIFAASSEDQPRVMNTRTRKNSLAPNSSIFSSMSYNNQQQKTNKINIIGNIKCT
eukprot:m.180494 g.180494  ORF g.180494 m.180494 type:complete len:55 (+) comp13576_c0_seq5:6920-7084(+)